MREFAIRLQWFNYSLRAFYRTKMRFRKQVLVVRLWRIGLEIG